VKGGNRISLGHWDDTGKGHVAAKRCEYMTTAKQSEQPDYPGLVSLLPMLHRLPDAAGVVRDWTRMKPSALGD
jgi:hypothetical protein